MAALVGLLLLMPDVARGLSADQLQRLYRAGIRGDLLQAIIQEKTVETCSLTIDELITLKKSGLSDSQLRALVVEKSFVRDRQPVLYGQDTRGIESFSLRDIERLKANGVSDEIIRDLILANARDADEQTRERAWRMLDHLRLYIY